MGGDDEKGSEKRRLRDEVAVLAEQVAGLRAELAAARAEQHCHGTHGTHQCFALMSHQHCNWGHCWCYTVHGCAVGPAQPLVWYGTVTGGGTTAATPAVTGSGFMTLSN